MNIIRKYLLGMHAHDFLHIKDDYYALNNKIIDQNIKIAHLEKLFSEQQQANNAIQTLRIRRGKDGRFVKR